MSDSGGFSRGPPPQHEKDWGRFQDDHRRYDEYRHEKRHEQRYSRDEPRGYRSSRPRDEEYDRDDERPTRRPRRSRFSDEPPQQQNFKQLGLIVPDAHTKPRRELFVGNTPANMNERDLLQALNSAMITTRMTIAPSAPIINVRTSNNNGFAFIEIRSIEETDHALSLNGIPFMGNILKIGRPSKYEGPNTICLNWQQVSTEGDYAQAMKKFSGQNYNEITKQPAITSLDTASIEKLSRELFIGNTSPLMTEVAIRAFLGMVARQLGQTIGPGDPFLSLRLSGHYAFVELRSIEEANAMLQFNGIPFMGARLKIGRPSKFAQAGLSDAYADLHWDDTLDAYRKQQLPTLHYRGDPTIDKPRLSFDQVLQLARVTENATRSIQIRNLLNDTRFQRDTDTDLLDKEENERRRRAAIVQGVLSDVEKECSKFGTVQTITPVDDLHVNITFTVVDAAILAYATLRYKTFDKFPCDLRFIPPTPPLESPLPSTNDSNNGVPAPTHNFAPHYSS